MYQVNWREEEPTDFITMQSDLDPSELAMKGDVLGRIIELTRLDQSMAFKSFELPIQIGRIRHCEFVVKDPRVSRTHARIEWRNGSIVIVDVSTYGTWIRFDGSGSDVLLRREECVLHGRGEIALGASFSDISIPTLKFSVT